MVVVMHAADALDRATARPGDENLREFETIVVNELLRHPALRSFPRALVRPADCLSPRASVQPWPALTSGMIAEEIINIRLGG